MVPVDANVPFVEAALNLRDCRWWLYAVPPLDVNLFLLSSFEWRTR